VSHFGSGQFQVGTASLLKVLDNGETGQEFPLEKAKRRQFS